MSFGCVEEELELALDGVGEKGKEASRCENLDECGSLSIVFIGWRMLENCMYMYVTALTRKISALHDDAEATRRRERCTAYRRCGTERSFNKTVYVLCSGDSYPPGLDLAERNDQISSRV